MREPTGKVECLTTAARLPESQLMEKDSLTSQFKYLSSDITFDLRDDMDIKKRISKVGQMMGALRNVWVDEFVELCTKYLFYLAIPINRLLWGCETWALKASNYKALDYAGLLHTQICTHDLGIRMLQVKGERITNKSVRERFFKLPNAESMIAARQLSYLGKMVRNHGDDRLPK
jgi:hypothetical protein